MLGYVLTLSLVSIWRIFYLSGSLFERATTTLRTTSSSKRQTMNQTIESGLLEADRLNARRTQMAPPVK